MEQDWFLRHKHVRDSSLVIAMPETSSAKSAERMTDFNLGLIACIDVESRWQPRWWSEPHTDDIPRKHWALDELCFNVSRVSACWHCLVYYYVMLWRCSFWTCAPNQQSHDYGAKCSMPACCLAHAGSGSYSFRPGKHKLNRFAISFTFGDGMRLRITPDE